MLTTSIISSNATGSIPSCYVYVYALLLMAASSWAVAFGEHAMSRRVYWAEQYQSGSFGNEIAGKQNGTRKS
jgi:hypothetical protein